MPRSETRLGRARRVAALVSRPSLAATCSGYPFVSLWRVTAIDGCELNACFTSIHLTHQCSQSPELTKKCHYSGCRYVCKASTVYALHHNLGSHVSIFHSRTTTVWYKGTISSILLPHVCRHSALRTRDVGGKVAIHRDVVNNSFTCPCGNYTSLNAGLVRSHAIKAHKSPTKDISAAPASKLAVVTSKVDPNPKDKLDTGDGECLVPTGPTVVNKECPLIPMTPMSPPERRISARTRASASTGPSPKSASSVVSKPAPSTLVAVACPLPTPPPTAGASPPRRISTPSKRKAEGPTPGPSKVRRVNNTRSVSASKAVASSSKTISHISPPKPLFTYTPLETRSKTSAVVSGSASTLASEKRPADESVEAPSSSKIQRVSKWPTIAERKTGRSAKAPQDVVVPLKLSVHSKRSIATAKATGEKARPGDNAPPAPAPATTSSNASTTPTPTKENAPKIRLVIRIPPRTPVQAQTPTPAKPPPPGAAAQPSTKASAGASAAQAKSLKNLATTRPVLQGEFEQWFAKWTAARRARHSAAEEEADVEAETEVERERESRDEDRDEDKTDWWRVVWTWRLGGVCYPTPEMFFSALELALLRHRMSAQKTKAKAKAKGAWAGEGAGAGAGAGGVLAFFGGYSIVAHPKVSALGRLDRVVAKMERIGFR